MPGNRKIAPMPACLALLTFTAGATWAAVPDGYYRGADLSYVNEMEDCGVVYRERDQPADPFVLLQSRGANLVRDRGNDSQAVVRGLGARLVLGTINGREVASSEPDRNVRREIYPSEVVSGVKVYKTQSADLIAGGVAATIDIQTLQPLDYDGADFVIRGGPVYYDEGADIPDYDPWGYRASGSYVFKANETFGLVLGLTAQQQKNGYPSFTGWGYNKPAVQARSRRSASSMTMVKCCPVPM